MGIGTRMAAAVGSSVLLLSMTGTAQAAPPIRSCPQGGPFVLYTTQELTELATILYGADAPAAVEYLLGAYDHNGDGSLCVQDLTGTDDRVDHYNAVDNAAR